MFYKPNIYKKDVMDIPYKKLKKEGINVIILDLDNTIAKSYEHKPVKETKDFIEHLKKQGFKVILFSNSFPKRVKTFANILDIEYHAFTLKPFKFRYKKILKEYKKSEVMMIGDQLFTDIWAAGRLDIKSALVDPLGRKDLFFTKINRFLEKIVMQKMEKKGIFKKGQYYE